MNQRMEILKALRTQVGVYGIPFMSPNAAQILLNNITGDEQNIAVLVNATGWNASSVSKEMISLLLCTTSKKKTQESLMSCMPSKLFTEIGGSPTSFNATSCPYQLEDKHILSYMLVIAILLLTLLSFLSRRTVMLRNCCGGYPGVAIPLSLTDRGKHRLGYSLAFGATITRCLSVIFSDSQNIFVVNPASGAFSDTAKSWLSALWKTIAMLMISLAYYPLFSCMTMSRKRLGSILGFLYSLAWLVLSAMRCPFKSSFVLKYDMLALELPVTVCLLFLTIKFASMVFKTFKRKKKQDIVIEPSKAIQFDSKYRHTKELLEKTKTRSVEANGKVTRKLASWWKERINRHSSPDFKFPTRFVCVLFVSLIATYEVSIMCIMVMLYLLRNVYEPVVNSEIIASFAQAYDLRETLKAAKGNTYIIEVCIYVAVAFTTLQMIIILTSAFYHFRRHIMMLNKGERTFLPKGFSKQTNTSLLAASMKFAGYQIAYVVWGYVITYVIVFLICLLLGAQIIQPTIDGRFSVATQLLASQSTTLIVSLIIFISVYMFCKFVFLQDRGSVFAIKNHASFQVATYLWFYANIAVGLFSCLLRIGYGMLIGVYFLSKLQRCILPRDYDTLDPGYKVYIGYLILEYSHSNAVLVTFCNLLRLAILEKRKSSNFQEPNVWKFSQSFQDLHFDLTMEETQSIKQLKNQKAKLRWHLIYTLVKNPSLTEFRRHTERDFTIIKNSSVQKTKESFTVYR